MMDSSGAAAPQQVSAGSSASLVWAISFGDLLTLLVCFFLVLTPWEKLRAPPKAVTYQYVVTPPPGLEVLGINFAPTEKLPESRAALSRTVERSVIGGKDRRVRLIGETPIFAKQVSFESMSGVESLQRTLTDEVKPLAEDASTVVIRLCDPSLDVVQVAGLLERMVGELGIDAKKRILSFPTSSCDEAVVMRPVSDVVVGAVTVLKELP